MPAVPWIELVNDTLEANDREQSRCNSGAYISNGGQLYDPPAHAHAALLLLCVERARARARMKAWFKDQQTHLQLKRESKL
jgi:hypothetical protein